MILISLIFLASFLSGCGGEKEKEVVEANKVNESAESQEEKEVEADLSQENIEVEAKLHSGKIKKWYLRKRENVETHKVYSSVFLPLIQDGYRIESVQIADFISEEPPKDVDLNNIIVTKEEKKGVVLASFDLFPILYEVKYSKFEGNFPMFTRLVVGSYLISLNGLPLTEGKEVKIENGNLKFSSSHISEDMEYFKIVAGDKSVNVGTEEENVVPLASLTEVKQGVVEVKTFVKYRGVDELKTLCSFKLLVSDPTFNKVEGENTSDEDVSELLISLKVGEKEFWKIGESDFLSNNFSKDQMMLSIDSGRDVVFSWKQLPEGTIRIEGVENMGSTPLRLVAGEGAKAGEYKLPKELLEKGPIITLFKTKDNKSAIAEIKINWTAAPVEAEERKEVSELEGDKVVDRMMSEERVILILNGNEVMKVRANDFSVDNKKPMISESFSLNSNEEILFNIHGIQKISRIKIWRRRFRMSESEVSILETKEGEKIWQYKPKNPFKSSENEVFILSLEEERWSADIAKITINNPNIEKVDELFEENKWKEELLSGFSIGGVTKEILNFNNTINNGGEYRGVHGVFANQSVTLKFKKNNESSLSHILLEKDGLTTKLLEGDGEKEEEYDFKMEGLNDGDEVEVLVKAFVTEQGELKEYNIGKFIFRQMRKRKQKDK